MSYVRCVSLCITNNTGVGFLVHAQHPLRGPIAPPEIAKRLFERGAVDTEAAKAGSLSLSCGAARPLRAAMLDLSCLDTRAVTARVCAQPAVDHAGSQAQFPLPQVQDVGHRLTFWVTPHATAH